MLASDTAVRLYVSLVERYRAALAPFAARMDLIVCLSASNYTHTGAQARALLANWTASLPGVNIQLVTTDDIGTNFPALAPISHFTAQARPFEWGHHEPTLLSVPHIQKYAYVWCVELDVTYNGNLTRWVEEVHAADPQADFITFREGPPPDKDHWQWGAEPNVYNATPSREPRALYLDVPAQQAGQAKRWRTGVEHLRLWSRGFLQTLAGYISQGMYVFGEAMCAPPHSKPSRRVLPPPFSRLAGRCAPFYLLLLKVAPTVAGRPRSALATECSIAAPTPRGSRAARTRLHGESAPPPCGRPAWPPGHAASSRGRPHVRHARLACHRARVSHPAQAHKRL